MNQGYILAQLRNEKNISQSDLAKQIGSTQASVAHWEAGRRNIPQDKLLLLSNVFNVSIDYLLGNSRSKQRYYDLTEKDNQQIEQSLEKIINDLETGLYSKDMAEYDEESRQLLINALEMGLTIAKREAKKRYTPKKYRD